MGHTSAQVAIAWLLHRDPPVVPIPATKTIAHLDDLIDAAEITLIADVLATLDELFAPDQVAGERKHAPDMALVEDPALS